MRTVVATTLGCRLNQADTALIIGRLREAGYDVIAPSKADAALVQQTAPEVVVINTCTVTANAARKSRQMARKFKKLFPNACVVAVGCDCVRDEASWRNEPGVDIVLTNAMKPNIVDKIEDFFSGADLAISFEDAPTPNAESEKNAPHADFKENAVASFPFTTKAYIKVQEGCDAFCSYCIVPHVRGRERSRDWSEVIDEAKKLLDEGHKELVLTGVNVTAYKSSGIGIADLVSKLVDIPGDFRIRVSSLEPGPANAELVEIMAADPKMCRFLHVPLQHGTDEILKKMNRSPETAEFAEFLNAAAEKVPGIHLGTDIIAGFPGETDELFERSIRFLATLPLANIHVFAFSARAGTPAANFADQIPKKTAKRRADRLKALSNDLAARFAESQIGKPMTVLTERRIGRTLFEGWSDNYISARVEASDASVGDLVKLTSFRM